MEDENITSDIDSIAENGTEGKKSCTIGDVARELGLNKSTVSRAISGKGRVSQATRERVLSFIQQQDYTPNVMAKGLAKGKTYNIGLVLPVDYSSSEFSFFQRLYYGDFRGCYGI